MTLPAHPDHSLSRRVVLRSLGLLGAGTVAAPLLASCSVGARHPSGRPPGPVASGGPRRPGLTQAGQLGPSVDVASVTGTPADAATTAAGLNRFATDLIAAIGTGTGLVCSPYSVAAALAMLRAGARGSTGRQIDEVLHASSGAALADGMSRLRVDLGARSRRTRNASGTKTSVALATADSLWAQKGYWWRESYLGELATRYAAGLDLVDFAHDASGATTEINRWTDRNTHGRITRIIAPGMIDGSTRFVLVNAIWLKAPWDEAFDTSATRPAAFHAPHGTVSVPMMTNQLNGTAYAEEPTYQAVSLPYAGGQLAMAVVVPRAVDGLAGTRAALGHGGLGTLLGRFRSAPVTVSLPRWQQTSTLDLTKPLKALGLRDAFSTACDLGAMTPANALMVGAVVQQAFISVNEQGTEAAAATAVIGVASGMIAPPVRVTADRPFFFCLYDTRSHAPLFVGEVTDPRG